MAKKSGLMEKMEAERRLAFRAARIYEQHFCCDVLTIALGRLGWGEKRLKEMEKLFSAVYGEYDLLREKDGQDDKEGVYFKACLDRELQRYCGSLFVPYNERYGISGK